MERKQPERITCLSLSHPTLNKSRMNPIFTGYKDRYSHLSAPEIDELIAVAIQRRYPDILTFALESASARKRGYKAAPRVGFLLPSLGVCGGHAVVIRHASMLRENGVDAFIISCNDDISSPQWISHSQVPIYSATNLCKQRQDQLDLLIATEWSTASRLHTIRAKRKAYFVQSDERKFTDDPKTKKNITQTYLEPVEYLTEAQWIKNWLKEEFGHNAELVPNGIDLNTFHRTESLTDKKQRPIVLLEGAIDMPYKGMRTAYEAASMLDVDIWIVSYYGAPPDEWKVSRFFQSVPMDQMKFIYSSADVFLKMSTVEGFPGPPLEAMACECPVVISDVTGIDEYIVNGINALVVSPGNIEDAASAIHRIITGNELRTELVLNGLETVKCWPWHRSLERMMHFVAKSNQYSETIMTNTRAQGDLVYPVDLSLLEQSQTLLDLQLANASFFHSNTDLLLNIKQQDMPGLKSSQLKALNTSSTTITIDFWDTLVVRKGPSWASRLHLCKALCNHLIKLGLSIKPIDIYQQIIAEECKHGSPICFFSNMIKEVISRLPIEDSLSVEEVIDLGVKTEIQYDQHFSVPNLKLIKQLDLMKAKGAKVYILSDYYHGKEYLRTLLRAHGIPLELFDDIYVSCDFGASKHTGDIYPIVRDLVVTANRTWVHIGDNIHSDVENSVRHGAAHSIHIPKIASFSGEPYFQPNEEAKEFSNRAKGWIRICSKETPAPPNYGCTFSPYDLSSASAVLSFFTSSLLLAAADKAAQSENCLVLFVSREGSFFNDCYNIAKDTLSSLKGNISSAYLPCSRRALAAPAMATSPQDFFEMYKIQYSYASVEDFVKSIAPVNDLPYIATELEAAASKHACANFTDVRECLSSVLTASAIEALQEYWEQQAHLLSAYTSQFSMATFKNIIICDVGWRGTIQHSLSLCFPHLSFSGLYFGIFIDPHRDEEVSILSRSGNRSGIVFDRRNGDRFEHVNPPAAIERVLTPPIPSCVGYETINNRVVPKFECKTIDSAEVGPIPIIQHCIKHNIENALAFLLCESPTDHALKEVLADLLVGYYETPFSSVADAWFETRHDDTFGASSHNPYQKLVPPMYSDSLDELIPVLNRNADSAVWRQGYMAWSRVHQSICTTR